jgi:hypothetical protein
MVLPMELGYFELSTGINYTVEPDAGYARGVPDMIGNHDLGFRFHFSIDTAMEILDTQRLTRVELPN